MRATALNYRSCLRATIAVFVCLHVAACGGKSGDSRAHREATTVGAPSLPRSAQRAPGTRSAAIGPLRVGPGQRYLNDGDNDPSNDNDADNSEKNLPDDDYDIREDTQRPENDKYRDKDDNVVAFGPAASAVDRRSLAVFAKRYYAAAVAADGAKACAMIYPTLANAVVEDYGRPPGPPYLRGKTCSAVMKRLFTHSRASLTTDFTVTDVRVRGNRGYVLLGSRKIPATVLYARRQHGTWKATALIGTSLP
jgi:hypothetical protein